MYEEIYSKIMEFGYISNSLLHSLQILVETGHIGRQASGAVTVTDGETVCSPLLII